jgi:hypothetical protein
MRQAIGDGDIVNHVSAISEIGDHLHVMLDPDHPHLQFVLDPHDEATAMSD